MAPRFHNRADAGQTLATMLMRYANRSDVLVLALPRGGAPPFADTAVALVFPTAVACIRGVAAQSDASVGGFQHD